MLQKSFSCTYTGFINMFVVNFVEIDQVVFSHVLQIGIHLVKNQMFQLGDSKTEIFTRMSSSFVFDYYNFCTL